LKKLDQHVFIFWCGTSRPMKCVPHEKQVVMSKANHLLGVNIRDIASVMGKSDFW
jgi:hypothetical protein